MGNFMLMATTLRHNDMISSFSADIHDLVKKRAVRKFQEECALVHWGSQSKMDYKSLVNINELDDKEHFKKITINELDYIQPDFVLFKNNIYLTNERQTRTAGQPDLIVEVWSENNSKQEKDFKFNLYSSSQVTEHWYIEQDSNEVICYYGGNKIENQSLTDMLETRGGLKFDLRFLAI